MRVNCPLLVKMFGYQMIPEVLQRKMGAALKRTEAELVPVPAPVLARGQEHCRLLVLYSAAGLLMFAVIQALGSMVSYSGD